MKAGWKTSEFWKNLGLLLGALGTAATTIAVACGWLQMGDADTITKSVGVIAAAVVSVGISLAAGKSGAAYSESRAKVKETQAFQEAHAKR